MPDFELSPVVRLLLSNQFRILSKLDPDYASYHQVDDKIAILEGGFEGLYPTVLGSFADNSVSKDVAEFTNRVILMMSNILDHEADLKDYDLSEIRRVGFDQHNESDYLSYGQYLLGLEHENWGRVEAVVNSHGPRLHNYRAMMRVFDQEIEGMTFDVNAAKRVLDAGHYRR